VNEYDFNDWIWIYNNIERRIKVWCNKWLSLGRCLTLAKPVLEATLVYWHSIAHISLGIQKNIKKKVFNFLWRGRKYQNNMAYINW